MRVFIDEYEAANSKVSKELKSRLKSLENDKQ